MTPLVFEGSIKENLLYGNNKISDNDLIELLKEFNFFNNEDVELSKIISNKSLSSDNFRKYHS